MNSKKINLAISILNMFAFASVLHIIFLQPKVVYVDSVRLLNAYKGMQTARETYQKKIATWKGNIDTLAHDVKRQVFMYEKEGPKMSPQERQRSQELIRTKQNQLAQYQNVLDEQARQEDQKMTHEIVSQVNTYLKKYGESSGYRIILAATGYGNLAYADEGLDITEEVLAGLNKEYTGK